MSTLYIQEFSNLSTIGGNGQGINKVPVGSLPNVIAFNSITLSSTSQPSTQLNAATQWVRLCANADCFIAFSKTTATTTTATITSLYIPAKIPEYLAVQGGGWIAATL